MPAPLKEGADPEQVSENEETLLMKVSYPSIQASTE